MTQADEKKMAFTAHLVELRQRLIVCAIAVIVGFSICYAFSEELYDYLKAPLIPALPEGSEFMAFTGVVEPFFTYLKVALVAGIILASPVILYETWAFVAPGLYENERRWFLPVVLVSVILFAAGVSFAYKVVFPVGFKYLLSFASPELRPVLSMELYFGLATKLLVAFGVVFQLPLFVLVLSRLGIVDVGMLVSYWKYALVVALIVGALLTPPDAFSQFLMAGPIMILYGISIVVAKVFGKKRNTDDEEASEDDDFYDAV